MKKLDIAEMLRIDRDHKGGSYTVPYGGVTPQDLLDAVEDMHKGGSVRFLRHYAAWFLFECGRIYGIRQERDRRRPRD